MYLPLCRFGRRPVMLVACVIQVIASIICAFSVNYVMFIFFRFLVAFSVSGVFECGFVLGEYTELIVRLRYGRDRRTKLPRI